MTLVAQFTAEIANLEKKASYVILILKKKKNVPILRGKNIFAPRNGRGMASQNSQENTCAGASFLIKLQAIGLQLYWKRYSGTGVFLWILQNL